MSVPDINPEVQRYLAAVRAELEDIEGPERADLLDDLEQHLLEVAAEGEASLEERLGPPAAYAADLRISAELAPKQKRPGVRSRLSSLTERIRALPGGSVTLDFMRELRPGWWVVRGYAFALAIGVAVSHSLRWVPLTGDGGAALVGIALVLGAIVASVALGRAAPTTASLRRLAIVLNAGIVLFALVAVGNGQPVGGSEHMITMTRVDRAFPALVQSDGSPITNICPYSANLKPLAGVPLYDQDGRPIDDVGRFPRPGQIIVKKPGVDIGGLRKAVVPGGFVVPDDGAPQPGLTNLFPRPQRVVDPSTGETRPFRCPTVAEDKAKSNAPGPSASPTP